ncbi:MAG TPA: hypothetical protein PKU94_08505 [Candidatus Hydrothermia bacterium]|nr:hypothetical protein [Candidatus Hydrothermia bacterium]HPQ05399.1 hypothetical protein [Methanothermobacter sp.]
MNKIPSLGECYSQATGQDPILGETGGICCLCHQETTEGHHKKVLGANFTDTHITSAGSVICPYCMLLKQDSNVLRRSMWFLTKKAFERFKKDKIAEVLSILPESANDPVYIYFTDSYQVTGWTRMIHHANTNKKTLRFGFNRETYTVNRREFIGLYDFAKSLRSSGLTKMELITCKPRIRRMIDLRWGRDKLNKLKKLKGNRIWEIVVKLV